MQPIIQTISEKRLVGIHKKMSLIQNTTGQLWREFMTRRKSIPNIRHSDLYSLQCYPIDYYQHFNPAREFEKWAAIEVTSFDEVPNGLEPLTLASGLYAVFLHRGAATAAPATFQYIFSEWLPASHYQLDDRPHFEVLGERYKNDHPDSEEEIWIPIRKA